MPKRSKYSDKTTPNEERFVFKTLWHIGVSKYETMDGYLGFEESRPFKVQCRRPVGYLFPNVWYMRDTELPDDAFRMPIVLGAEVFETEDEALTALYKWHCEWAARLNKQYRAAIKTALDILDEREARREAAKHHVE